jgi:hypothetical protein
MRTVVIETFDGRQALVDVIAADTDFENQALPGRTTCSFPTEI